MQNSEQLEQEAEQTRASIEDTLEELRARMTLGQVMDELVDRAREGRAGAFFRNLGRQAVDNPLPVAVIGAGLAWLMVSNGRSMGRPNGHLHDDRLHDRLSDAREQAAEARGHLSETARDSKARLQHAADTVGEQASSAYSSASQGVRRAASAIGHSASDVGHQAMRKTSDLVDFCKEQPLIVAGIGLALGAAIGAMLPSTETEDRVVGDASDRLKHDMAKTAQAVKQDAADVAKSEPASGERERRRPDQPWQSGGWQAQTGSETAGPRGEGDGSAVTGSAKYTIHR